MNWALKQITPPSVKPVTLVELKSQVHITHGEQDSTLEAYLAAGTRHAENYQRKSYINQEWELTLDCIPAGPIYLLRGPVQSLLEVKIYDEDNNETVVDNSNFYVDTSHEPAKMVLNANGEWPNIVTRSTGALKITYSAGYGVDGSTVPDDYKHAIKLFAAFADDNRAAEEAELPRAVRDLLTNDRVDHNAPW